MPNKPIFIWDGALEYSKMSRIRDDINYRLERLKALYNAIEVREEAIVAALYTDFKKPRFESIATETAYVLSDIKNTIRQLKSWSRPKSVWPSLLNFPAVESIHYEPYGKVLIIAPWNYPFQLALAPLTAAIAAGNTVVLKPSELTPSVSAVLSELISAVFTQEEVLVQEGGPEIAQELLQERWDYIFFTGSVAVGKIVAAAAAKHLTPVTLELGGKNPCIVAADTDIKLTAKRIVWGKFLNAGQTCIAPDYILVHASIYEPLVSALKVEIEAAYGKDPEQSPDYARIISDKHWVRLEAMSQQGTVLYGGTGQRDQRYWAPTLIAPDQNSALMQEELFGPILPLVPFTEEKVITKWIQRYEKPLAFYIFTKNIRWAKQLMDQHGFGGGCINDTILHFNNKRLPFGGIGHSGMGAYHGQWGFETFSHRKAIVYKPFWGDVPLRYAPYLNKIKFVKKIMKLF